MAHDNRPSKIIRNARLLNIEGHSAERADILIENNTIDAVGPPGLAAPLDAEVIEAGDYLLMPGLVNAHTHGHGALAKGCGDRWTLELLLNNSRWISGHQSVEVKYLSTLIGALEMIRKGCTACYDLFLELPLPSPEGVEAITQAYLDAGMRAVVAPMMADRTFYEAIPGLIDALPPALGKDLRRIQLESGAAHIEACRRLLKHSDFDRDKIRLALAPTIPLLCSDGFITGNRDLAAEYGVGLHMHLAESKLQAVVGMERYGKTLTAHLDSLGFLNPQFTAAHSVWLDADDMTRLAAQGCSVAHNPGSNMRLGSGLGAAVEMRRAGINVGIGTDGANCSDNQNMFEAMRLASFVSRVRSHDYETWLRTDDVLSMATRGSAEALGFDHIARIAPGCKADIVFLDLNHVNWIPLNDAVNQLVHTEDGSAVSGVMSDGELVLWQGEFTRIDIASVRRKIEAAVEDRTKLNRDAKTLALQLEDHVGQYCIGLSRQPYHVHGLAGADY